MRVLSATEAISPALDRTRSVLLPFKKGRSWKLAATAYLSAMGCLFLPIPLVILLLPWCPTDGMSRMRFVLIYLGVTALVTVFTSAVFYIGARLEFALFDIVLFKAQFVAPLWHNYGPHTRRWAWVKVSLGTIIGFIVGSPIGIWVIRSARVESGQPLPPVLVDTFALVLVFGTLCMCFSILFSSLLGDFVLPYIALENASLRDAVGAFVRLCGTESRQMIYFALMKIVLGIVGAVALQVATILVEIVAFIPLCLIGFVGLLLLRPMGEIGRQVLMVAGGLGLELVGVVLVFYCLILMQGCVNTFFRAYGLYFLGGRYPLLGDLLEPPSKDFAIAPLPPDLPPLLPIEGTL